MVGGASRGARRCPDASGTLYCLTRSPTSGQLRGYSAAIRIDALEWPQRSNLACQLIESASGGIGQPCGQPRRRQD